MGQEDEDKPNSKKSAHYSRPMLNVTLLSAVLLGFLGLAVESGLIPLIGTMAVCFTVIFMVACWSVLGPGSYLKRTIWAHLYGLIPLVGLLLGVMVMLRIRNQFDEVFMFMFVMVMAMIPVSVAGQFVFWILRGCFGYQFVPANKQPQRRFTLRDIFVLTFFVALGFAVPQITSSMFQSNASVRVEGQTGQQASQQMLAQESKARITSQNQSALVHGRNMVASFFGNLMCVPFLFFVFLPEEGNTGCLFSFLYAIFGVALIGVIASLLGGGAAAGQVIIYLGFLGMAFSGVLATVLLILRENGVRLMRIKKTGSGVVFNSGE